MNVLANIIMLWFINKDWKRIKKQVKEISDKYIIILWSY